MEELLCRIVNAWKKNIVFFLVFIVFILCEIPYITSIQGTEQLKWYECINYFYVLLWALPAIAMMGYIIFMRFYMPKAKKGTIGIVFYVVNANEKQYQAIRKKFIAQFEKIVNAENAEYSVVVIDDYHSQKYYSLLNKPVVTNDGEKQAKILKKRRGRVAILIDCINGGEGEELFCRMVTNVGVMYSSLQPNIREILIHDISTAFSPLREVDIMKLTETPDLSSHSISMGIICKYILASTCFHCGDFVGAIKLLETIKNSILTNEELPKAIKPIINVLGDRFAICYRIQAHYEYQMYCINRRSEHLVRVREAINNCYCKMAYEGENKILEGICSFVLDRNIDYAIHCMDVSVKMDPAAKFNKIFLLLFKRCTINNVGRTYNIYKTFGLLTEDVRQQIEEFTFYEYKKDTSKKQLLLILFFIYDYQGNGILAKRCFEEFCSAFPWVFESELNSIFSEINKRYESVKYEEGEVYCI